MSHLDRVLDRLERIKRSGGNWVASCPAHSDRSPSLTVKEGEDAIVLHCFAGCSFDDIVDALGLVPSDLFYEPPTASRESSDLGRKLREIELAYYPPPIDWGSRLETFMWDALRTNHLSEEEWAHAIAKAGVKYPDLMAMDYEEARKYDATLVPGPLFTFLSPLAERLGVDWKDLAGEALKKLAKHNREYRQERRLDLQIAEDRAETS